MYDMNALAKKLISDVKSGALTEESASLVYDAAEAKNAVEVAESAESTSTEVNEEVDACALINNFLNERIQESVETTAPAETNPATHVEDEIDEKLPVETPNEPTPIGCVADIEKTDKAIEDAKKDLDVAGKLAEMKAKHDAEKDTTQQHEVIKQVAEESADDVVRKNTKLNIYESCDAGLITPEEKDELLAILN